MVLHIFFVVNNISSSLKRRCNYMLFSKLWLTAQRTDVKLRYVYVWLTQPFNFIKLRHCSSTTNNVTNISYISFDSQCPPGGWHWLHVSTLYVSHHSLNTLFPFWVHKWPPRKGAAEWCNDLKRPTDLNALPIHADHGRVQRNLNCSFYCKQNIEIGMKIHKHLIYLSYISDFSR